MTTRDFIGTGILLQLFARRDRLLLPIWVLSPVVLVFVTAGTFAAMAGQELESVLTEFNQDALISALLGPVMTFDLPGAVVWRGVSQFALVLGIGSLLTVIRHTRVDEETGRTELIRAYVVGRYASLTAALILTLLANIAAGLLIVCSIMVLGGEAEGSLIFGATMAANGWFFGGIGALGAQLRETSRSARGLGIAALGLGLVMAILNNFLGGYSFFNWITPMAWQRLTQPFASNQSWALLYCAVFTATPAMIAYVLSARRDLAAGIFPTGAGRSEAAPHFSSPLALAWRLRRGNFISCSGGIILYITAFAAISPGLSASGGMSNWLSGLGGTSWTDEVGLGFVFISVSIYLMAMFVAVYAMTTILHLKKEEIEGRAEVLLDKQVSRIPWMSSYVAISAMSSAVLLLLMGIVGGAVYGLATNDLGNGFWQILGMSAANIPTVWVLLSVTACLYGLLPQVTAMGWAVWVFSAILELAWEAKVVDWSWMCLSPFSYAHYTLDITSLPLLPLFWLLCFAALLTELGLIGFRRRDISTRA